ncbi:hypothetical protein IX321_000764 [Bacteroides pyogenes]|nr:hypothetical protein [Bacteroides pyogenes]MBR8716611.1 hypothetical protein [Bacteroides pyogenes]MBR8724007.1 hypothetical protein [Bacteroides pyogenes]MBR8737556.1 hypothetical protein [Bacteroides pyogenes]MBR8746282.1 hypothetical protein [Bacteroides pyogenes]
MIYLFFLPVIYGKLLLLLFDKESLSFYRVSQKIKMKNII